MGEVYQARDTKLDRYVALKIASPNLSDTWPYRNSAPAQNNYPGV